MIHIGLIVPPGFQPMCFAPLSVFEAANATANDPIYQIQILSERGGPVCDVFGIEVDTKPLDGAALDTLFVGTPTDTRPPTPRTTALLRQSARTTRRIASLCTGTFTLAEAGLLDGRRATTHWAYAQELQDRFPNVTVERDSIYVADGQIWTSAGMTAGIDLALCLIERDVGTQIACATAKTLVVPHRRAGGQSQHSALLAMKPKSDRIQDALAFARTNLNSPLCVESLANAARLRPRQFSRVFRAETGLSPAKAIEALRLEGARLMLEQGRLPIEEIARTTGFGDSERMRRSFVRCFGQPPQAIRNGAHPLASF